MSLYLMAVMLFFGSGCQTMDPQQTGTRPVDHKIFTEILQEIIDEEGLVDYEKLKNSPEKLDEYLKLLSSNAPNDANWRREEKLAYWINAYNAFTLKLIIDYYPVASIKDIGGSIQVPFVNSPWDIEFIAIGEEKLTLNNVEHNILRKLFDEPRIHFAINCASYSCPVLRNEAYIAEKLETQLVDQAKSFLTNKSKNLISSDELKLSKIFKWFSGDFEKDKSLRENVAEWSGIEIEPEAKIEFLEYDWSLNEAKKAR